MATTFHPDPMPVAPGWGPLPADPANEENSLRFQRIVDYFRAAGFAGTIAVDVRSGGLPIPGFGAAPDRPYAVAHWPEPPGKRPEDPPVEDAEYDYTTVLNTPHVTLTEMKNHFRFGDPRHTPQFQPYVELKPKAVSDSPVMTNLLSGYIDHDSRYAGRPGQSGLMPPAGTIETDPADGSRWILRAKPMVGGITSYWFDKLS